ncbi:hypothetical protein RDI58_004316 [Solanum bulbocastanum]|uniref:Uncharacterized protein n=1 Tax=Solanum bulbocastanum TaxID=147425 RepID=A0AAN8YL72_SOLBU
MSHKAESHLTVRRGAPYSVLDSYFIAAQSCNIWWYRHSCCYN